MKKSIPFILGILISTSALSAQEKKYDCTPEEVLGYIKNNTVNLNMPSGVTKPKQFTEALIQTKQEEAAAGGGDGGEEECFNIWSGDIDLNEEWKELMEKLENLDFSFDFSIFGGLDLNALLSKIGEEFDKAMDGIMEELNKGVCERMAEIDWSSIGDAAGDYFTTKIDKYYDIDLSSDDWWSDEMKEALNGEMKDLGNYVFDPEELKEDIDSETKRKIKKLDDDFWEGL